MARTAVARSAWAVQMMTGTSGSNRLISGSASMPFMRGMLRSIRITAGCSRWTCCSAAAPSSAVTTSNPLACRTAPRSDRISASSSTTRILVNRSSDAGADVRGRRPELVDGHVADRGHRPGALGQQEQIQLHELVPLALEEVLDPGARLEPLAHARDAQMLAVALHVDPRADPHVPVQRAVGLLEVDPGMGGRVGVAIHRQLLAHPVQERVRHPALEDELGGPQHRAVLEVGAAREGGAPRAARRPGTRPRPAAAGAGPRAGPWSRSRRPRPRRSPRGPGW